MSRDSIIFVATVVFPEALPPHIPEIIHKKQKFAFKFIRLVITNYESFFQLSLRVIPRWPSLGIYLSDSRPNYGACSIT